MKMIIKYLILSLLTVFFVACPDNNTAEPQGNVTLTPFFGYRLTVSTPNDDNNTTAVILQVAEGGIHDGTNSTDLLAGVDPTTDTSRAFGGSVGKFNDGSDDQSLAEVFHSVENGDSKMIQVLGANRLMASSGVFRIRIIGRGDHQERGNGIVVTLLGANGTPVGTASSASTGFVRNSGTSDGFVVDFRASDGAVLTQPTIFDLSGSLPALPGTTITGEVYGYRLTVSTPNNDDDATVVILQVAEGGIYDGTKTTDLLAGIVPIANLPADHGTSTTNFNDESDGQTVDQLFHSFADGNSKMIEVLGSNHLVASSGVFRIRIVGRDGFQERGNQIVVTLLDKDGDPIGTASVASSGFSRDNDDHDGFVVDFSASDGAVLTQPTIFDLSGSLPALPNSN